MHVLSKWNCINDIGWWALMFFYNVHSTLQENGQWFLAHDLAGKRGQDRHAHQPHGERKGTTAELDSV